jgi:hypothetical protein
MNFIGQILFSIDEIKDYSCSEISIVFHEGDTSPAENFPKLVSQHQGN